MALIALMASFMSPTVTIPLDSGLKYPIDISKMELLT